MDLRELPNISFRRHPWETVRARFFGEIMRGCVPVSHILDVGAGDGWLAQKLLDDMTNTEAVCWDAHYGNKVPRSSARLRFTALRPNGRFDLLLLLDVLEHLRDDRAFLTDLVTTHMKPGAYALVSVPAWQALYCRHDAAFTHYRRYNPAKLRNVLNTSGLTILREGGIFHSFLLPRTVTVVKEKLFGRGKAVPKPLLWKHGESSARMLEAVLIMETKISHFASRAKIPLPGLSHWALCRKD